MIYNEKIQKAIRFAVKTHEVYQKQKRKGKDIPYITHPLTVGFILARAGASEDVIVAGILHDTMEDSIPEKKVTREMLAVRFGESVANLVESVTEQRKDLPWVERKKEALDHIKTFSKESNLLKSADVLANTTEIVEDYQRNGEAIFERFNGPKSRLLKNYVDVITALTEQNKENPLAEDLRNVGRDIQAISSQTI